MRLGEAAHLPSVTGPQAQTGGSAGSGRVQLLGPSGVVSGTWWKEVESPRCAS